MSLPLPHLLPRLFLLRCGLLALAVAGLSACGSTSKDDSSDTSDSGSGTMMSRVMKGADLTKVSAFEKEFNTASAGDRGSMKNFGSKNFKTGDFSGGPDTYKTGLFSQAGKSNRMGTQDARFGSQSNRMGNQSFDTKESRFGNKMARQNSQMFQQGSKSFKTGDFADAQKSIDDNKRIYIEPTEAADQARSANAYSEDEVKRLMGRSTQIER